jgi:hypothetical protein
MPRTSQRSDGIRIFPPVPEDFDARKATPLTLLRHGLPRRPDPKRMPRLAAIWDEVASQRIRYITPDVKPLAELVPDQARRRQEFGTVTDSAWAGDFLTSNVAENFVCVGASWNIADVGPPPGSSQNFWAVNPWVGIDGADGDTDLCQAGTTIGYEILSNGTVQKYAVPFFEWVPNTASGMGIGNFPIAFGDTIGCVVCIQSPTKAVALFYNHTTQILTSIGFSAPANTTLVGNTAEWIAEITTPESPVFQPITFRDVFALAQGAETELADQTGYTLVNCVKNNTPVATATLIDSHTLEIDYAG